MRRVLFTWMGLAAILLVGPLLLTAAEDGAKGKLSLTADNWVVTLSSKGRPQQLKGGKDPIEVAAGTYTVRYQVIGGEVGKSATIAGSVKGQVTIEAGKTTELKVGSPLEGQIGASVKGGQVTFNLVAKDAGGNPVAVTAAPVDGKAVTPKVEVVDKDGKVVYTASLAYG